MPRRRRLLPVGAYENLIRDTVEAVLQPGRPMRIDQLASAVTPRLYALSKDERYPAVDVTLLVLVLRANPTLFVEVAPGVWMRRADGPEAGVPARPKRPPFAGSAAAAASPPEAQVSLDAVGGSGARTTSAAP